MSRKLASTFCQGASGPSAKISPCPWKAWLDIGNGDKAFEHLDAGNRMKRATIGYEPSQTTAAVSGMIATFTADRLEQLGGHGDPSERPIFIVGMPRSGTTLVEQILSSHPQVFGAGELRNIRHIAEGLTGFPESIPGIEPSRFRDMGSAYLAGLPAASGEARFVIDKMPANFFYIGLIRLILPNARIIHCRREAADTALSCYSKLFQAEQNFSYDLTELGRFYCDYERMMAHWRQVLPASHFLEVDYEAVVDNAEQRTRQMLDFLGLPWEDACLEFYRNERAVRTASVNQVRQPIYKSSSGRWKTFETHLQPLLQALGRQ